MRPIETFSAFIIAMVAVIMNTPAWGWDNKITHKDLTGFAADHSILEANKGDILAVLGLESLNKVLFLSGQVCEHETRKTDCSVKDWLKYGAEKEDAARPLAPWLGRFQNHFHNPFTDEGLSDMAAGESALVWAQDSAEQGRAPFGWPEGDQSWSTLRDIYFEALTQTDDMARQAVFARLFKGLGHQMHLVQDMAVPAHVRNDAHAEETMQVNERWYVNMLVRKSPLYFESWAKIDFPEINRLAAGPPVSPSLHFAGAYAERYGGPAAAPVSQLWDADVYTGANPSAGTAQGLAEYTNANFFSEDTVFAAERYGDYHVHFSPFPKISSLSYEDFINDQLLPDRIWSEDGVWDSRLYIPKHGGHGEAVDHFLAVGYFSTYGKQDPYLYKTFFLDERCHRSYAQKLVPRAVGYSAALLDYFFRGRLNTTNPVARYGPGFTISGLRFDARNATRAASGSVEPMGAGKLDLVCRYFDPAAGQWQGSVASDVYALSGPDDPINSAFVGISADFPEPIPFGARELSFMLVFSGTLGHEAGAVIGTRIDTLMPSRIAFEHQPGGAPNASDIHIVLPDGSDDRIVTASDGISRWYYSPAWSPVGDGAMLAYEFESCGLCDGSDGKRRITLHDLWWGYAPLLLSDFVTVDQPPADYCGEAWGSVMAAPSFSADGTRMSAVNWVAAGTLDAVATIGIETDTSWHWIKDYELWRQQTVTGSTPEWSPTRDEIVFCIADRFNPVTGGRQVENDIYVIDTAGGELSRLTRDSDLNAHPAWSPDGEWIVFVSDRDGEGPLDIWVMDRSGNDVLKILDCDPDCWHPVFSPDGMRMAFVQDDSIHVMSMFEQNPVRITHYGYRTAAPDWSPVLAPPEVFLEASADTVASGQAVTLTWHSNDADKASIDGGIGDVDLNGTLAVVPDATTTYTITVLGLGGYAQAGITIFVHEE